MIPEGYNLKRFLCLLLCATLICTLCACGKSDQPDAVATQDANFAPETTAVAGSGLAQAIASVEDDGNKQPTSDEAQDAQPAIQDEPVAQDVAIDTPVGDAAPDSA